MRKLLLTQEWAWHCRTPGKPSPERPCCTDERERTGARSLSRVFHGLIRQKSPLLCSEVLEMKISCQHCHEWSRTITLEDFLVVIWLTFLKELAFTWKIPSLFLPTLFPLSHGSPSWLPTRIARSKFFYDVFPVHAYCGILFLTFSVVLLV